VRPKPRRSIADYPELVASFHPTKNGNLRPEQIARASNKKLWWKCPKGPDHEWQANPLHRTAPSPRGCPFCAGKRVSITNALATCNPKVAKEWHPTKNAPLSPRVVVAGSERKAWWKCPKGPDHEWCAVISSRAVYGVGCPFCAGRRPSVTNSLAVLEPELAKQWHPTRNRPLTPLKITLGSDRKVWWRCQKNPRHAWPTTVSNRLRGTGCPFCLGFGFGASRSLMAWRAPRGKNRSGAIDGAEIARLWHPTKNGSLTPWDVTAHSARPVWWKCPEGPDHEFQRPVGRQVDCKEKCPFCSNDRVSVTNNLAVRFPRIAREWHPTRNGKLTPRDIVAGAARYFWFKCVSGHEWRTYLPNRTRLGVGCPHCSRRKRRPAMTRRVRERIVFHSEIDHSPQRRAKSQ
jgi:hypothetical protein